MWNVNTNANVNAESIEKESNNLSGTIIRGILCVQYNFKKSAMWTVTFLHLSTIGLTEEYASA